MYVAVIPNRGSPPAILLRESYREAGNTRNRTLANLSAWPAERIAQLRAVLRGDRLLPASDAVQIVRALPHGHVLAALSTARRIELDAVLPRRAPQRRRDLAFALITARMLDPAAKLATARMLDPTTASHSLGEMLALGSVTARELYATLDWLGSEQSFIEATLARRHLKNGMLLLYDVTSTYLEGRCCELARHGYSRDHRRDRPQLVIGLLCAPNGCPVARGAGTVDVAFVMDGASPIIPAPADVANMQAAIDALRPVTADCIVFAPVGDPLAVTVADLQPDTQATQQAIGDAIQALLLHDAQPGGTLWLNRLTAAISDAGGVESFNLITPSANVVSASGHTPIFAPVTYA